MKMEIDPTDFRVREGDKVDLSNWPTNVDPVYKSKKDYKKLLRKHVAQLNLLQHGVTWLDPVMGLIGMAVILAWSWSLVRSAGAVLLDAVPDTSLSRHIREHLEIDGDRVSDLHTWRLRPGHIGLIASVVSDRPQSPDTYKQRVAHIPGLAHVTVEVHACGDHV
jgi:Co/Zn/Cd efflux system component